MIDWSKFADEVIDKLEDKDVVPVDAKEQSPVDIIDAETEEAEQPPLEFNYSDLRVTVENDTRTILIYCGEKSFLKCGDESFQLIEAHFHAPSDHAIDGKKYPMEMHLVHKAADESIVVVAVLMAEGEEYNDRYATILDDMPDELGAIPTPCWLNVADLLPKSKAYYSYKGSLTMAPFTEGVRWFVLVEPAYVADEQIGYFTDIYPDNAREVQPLHGRKINKTT